MRKLLTIFLILLITCAFIAGCSENEESKARFASDPDVIAEWDDYPMLSGVPRFDSAGVFDGFYVNDERTVVSFLGVTKETYEAYTERLMSEGFRLKENSSVWVTEGITGVPEFTRNGQVLVLVWSANGTLDISAETSG